MGMYLHHQELEKISSDWFDEEDEGDRENKPDEVPRPQNRQENVTCQSRDVEGLQMPQPPANKKRKADQVGIQQNSQGVDLKRFKEGQ